jgi:hypothetical protein
MHDQLVAVDALLLDGLVDQRLGERAGFRGAGRSSRPRSG